ncbi:Colicin V production protein [Proteiniphilum saccharofermentans]|uniref:Colicin V production protein n=1 Tax=Proteiniphilum saccharofermentans TaxID=1642647 RepID=A0A1R3T038_9BACT|nr:CvpA family protein [Proteiniphilum saccharofermentans]SCD19422.1 Colicin V production protein [Proteiniphilum saccharofermentans]
MNWFDLTVGILLLIAFINGYRKGLIMQLVGLATIILAAVFGGRLAQTILPQINRIIDLSPEVARVLSFILAFVAIAVGLSLVGRLLQRFIDIVFLSFINRLLGAVIAAGTMMVFLSIILNLVLMLDLNQQVINKKTKEESFFFERVEAVVPAIVPYLQPQLWEEVIPEKYREEIEKKSEPAIDSTYQQRHFST